MKRIIFVCSLVAALSMASAQPSFARDDDEDYKIVLTLKNGSVKEAYIRSSLMEGVSNVGVSDTPNGKFVEYTAEEVESLVYSSRPNSPEEVVYVTSRATKTYPSLWGRGKEFKEPVFLRVIYKGKNVTGYVIPCVDVTQGNNVRAYSNTYRYYYKLDREEVAQAYWFASSGITVGIKAALKVIFKPFPEILQLLDDGKLNTKEFVDSPEMILPIIDSIMEERK